MSEVIFYIDNYVYFDCGWRYDCFYYNRKYIGSTLDEARSALEKLYAVEDFEIDVKEIMPVGN